MERLEDKTKRETKLIEAAYQTYMRGIAIPIFDIPLVYSEARIRLSKGESIHEIMMSVRNKYTAPDGSHNTLLFAGKERR